MVLDSQSQEPLLGEIIAPSNGFTTSSIPSDSNTISAQSIESSFTKQFTPIVDYENISTINPISGNVITIDFSPVELILAEGNAGSTVGIWDIRTGTKIHNLIGHAGWIRSVAFSPDGKTVASGSDDWTIKLWNVSTGVLIRTYSGHSSAVGTLDFSSDGSMLVSGSADTVRIWETNSNTQIDSIASAKFPEFSPNGKLIAAEVGGNINVYNASTRAVEATFTGGFGRFAFHPNGKVLASTISYGIRFWNVTDQTVIGSVTGHSNSVINQIKFNADGTLIASAGDDHSVRVWKTSTMTSVHNLTYHSAEARSVSFSYDGKYIASGSSDFTLKIFNLDLGRKTAPFSDYFNTISTLAYSPDGSMIASGTNNMTIRLWNSSTGNEIRLITGHPTHVTSVEFSPDGTILLSSSGDDTVRTWNVSTGASIDIFSGHSKDVNHATFSRDGKLIASSSYDQTVKIWNVTSGALVHTLTGQGGTIMPVEFTPDGKILTSGSSDQSIKIWNVTTGIEITTLSGHTAAIRSLSMHPDGVILASSSSDGVIKLWNMTSLTEITELNGHTGDVTSINFSSNGILASTSYDFTIKLWNVSTYSVISSFDTGSEVYYYSAFSPDGSKLATAGLFINVLRVWTVGTFLFSISSENPVLLVNTELNVTMGDVGSYYASWAGSLSQEITQSTTTPSSYGTYGFEVEAAHMGRKLTQTYQFLIVIDFDDFDGDLLPNVIEETTVGLNELDHTDASEDLDNDGLSNLLEFVENTFITNNDTDTDGIADGYEYFNDLDPLQIDNSSDKDIDGLSNILEFQLNSKANNTDSDSDGIDDGYEYQHSLLILIDDSSTDVDDDELSNLEEFVLDTDPNNPDTDDDGWRDDLDPTPLLKNDVPTVVWTNEIEQLNGQLTNQSTWNWKVNTSTSISIEIWLNDVSKGSQNSTFSWSLTLAEGGNNITTKAWYNYDYNFYSHQASVTLNTTTPVITLVGPQEIEYYQSRVGSPTTITIDVEGYDGFLRYYWDSGQYESTTNLDILLPTSDGEHILYLKAVNDIGNSKTIEFTFFTDNTVPTAEVSGISNEEKLSGVVTITITPDDLVGSGISYITIFKGLDLVENKTSNFVFEWDTENIPNGNYEVSIHIVDKAGNELIRTYSVSINNESDSGISDTVIYAVIGVSVVLVGGGYNSIYSGSSV